MQLANTCDWSRLEVGPTHLESELFETGHCPVKAPRPNATADVTLPIRHAEEGQVGHHGHVPHTDVQSRL